jgi:hypothetical protein
MQLGHVFENIGDVLPIYREEIRLLLEHIFPICSSLCKSFVHSVISHAIDDVS